MVGVSCETVDPTQDAPHPIYRRLRVSSSHPFPGVGQRFRLTSTRPRSDTPPPLLGVYLRSRVPGVEDIFRPVRS